MSWKCKPLETISLELSYDFGMRFLDLSQDNKNCGKDSLKFMKTFGMSVDHSDVTTVGTKEDYYPLGSIFEAYGKRLQDFGRTEEASVAVRHLCSVNRTEHSYEERPERWMRSIQSSVASSLLSHKARSRSTRRQSRRSWSKKQM